MKITIDKTIINLQDINVTSYSIEKQVHKYINDAIIENKVDHIITNVRMGSILQDSVEYSVWIPLNNILSTPRTPEPYLIGNYSSRKVFVDPFMRWDDNRIIIKYDKSQLISYKINKILKKTDYKELLEEIIIDKEIGDKLI